MANTFKLKSDKIAPPNSYLGATLEYKDTNRENVWTVSSVDYVKSLIANLDLALKNKPKWNKLPKISERPMTVKYFPELDGSPKLNSNDTKWYQETIGVLRWATELGRVDILNEVSILSRYQCSPREGHIQELLKIFAFLRSHPKLTLYFDPKLPNLNYEDFVDNSEDFREIYHYVQEDLPFDMPEPRGLPVTTSGFADASFGANRKTRRSHSDYLLFVSRAPIVWYSKKQSMIEGSAFSAEFVALKVYTEAVKHLRFKL